MNTVRKLKDERGGVILIVAISLFAVIFFVAFVIDVGNWKEHKRHLQLEADAAAFAAAGSFSIPCNSGISNTVNTVAHNYGGTDATHISPPYIHNDQVGSKYVGGYIPNMHILVNSVSYYGDAGAGENTGGATCPGSTDSPNQFCTDPSDPSKRIPGVDIKATETDLPWFFGGVVRKINAHALACLMQETSSANSLPVAVPNPKPKSAAAIFINRGSGNAIVGTPLPLTPCLVSVGPPEVPCPAPGGITLWSSPAGGSNVPVVAQTGLVIAISGLNTLPLTGNLAAICGQPLTTCFDATNDPPTVGVNFIQGWSNTGDGKQPAPPVLKGVQLFPGNCPGDAYFQYITGGCSLTLAAVVAAQAPDGSDLSGMSITVTGAGCPNKGCALAKNTEVPAPPECAAVLAGASGRCWIGSIPVSARAGAQELHIAWNESRGTVGTQDCTKGQGCNGTFPGIVQQAYTADDLPRHNISGPLQIVQINSCPSSACLGEGNSLPLGASAPPVAVTIGLKGALQNALNASDPNASCTFDDGSVHPFACLKVTVTNSGSGSTQSINCDPLANPKKDLDDQLALGCSPEYKINNGTSPSWSPCPSANQMNDTDHQMPWQCTELFTGNKTPLVSRGLNRRLFGSTTPPPCPLYGERGHNNWDMYDPNDPSGRDGFPENDPRIVGVYLTAYGAFTHTSGTSLTIPITDFATFYITGYDGSPCTNPPVTDHPDDPIPDAGTIVGHFIKYVDKLNSGGGTTPCDVNSFGACVPVLTK
jgi:Putative Flp pilus-assembly TadE/G-like